MEPIIVKRPKLAHQMTEAQFEATFPDEEACKAYLVARRWPDGVYCPRCGAVKVFPVGSMPYKWQCYAYAPGQGYRFSHIPGAIFENTNRPLRQWFKIVHLMLTSKKGIGAPQIKRHMGFGPPYETAWSMCHKIRAALIEPVGSFHKVSRKYFPLYVAEFLFRSNNRMNADIFGTAISGC
jgi:Transposase zinc-ribbon domain